MRRAGIGSSHSLGQPCAASEAPRTADMRAVPSTLSEQVGTTGRVQVEPRVGARNPAGAERHSASSDGRRANKCSVPITESPRIGEALEHNALIGGERDLEITQVAV